MQMQILLIPLALAAVVASYFIDIKLFAFGIISLVLSCISNLTNVWLYESKNKGNSVYLSDCTAASSS